MNKQIHRVLTLWDVIKPKYMHWLNRFQGTVPWDSNLERSKTSALVTSFIQLAPCEVSDHVKFLDLFMDHPLPLFRQAYGFTTKTRNIFASSPFVPEMMKGNNFPNFKVSWITEVWDNGTTRAATNGEPFPPFENIFFIINPLLFWKNIKQQNMGLCSFTLVNSR